MSGLSVAGAGIEACAGDTGARRDGAGSWRGVITNRRCVTQSFSSDHAQKPAGRVSATLVVEEAFELGHVAASEHPVAGCVVVTGELGDEHRVRRLRR